MTHDDLIKAISEDSLRDTTMATITYSLRLDPSGNDLRLVIAQDVAEKFPVFFPKFAKAVKQTGALAGLGVDAAQTGVAVAATGTAFIPVVGPIISGLIGLFSGMFGGDGELGPVTPGVVNPETGEGVHCGKPDEVARTQLLAQGNIAWFRGRYPATDLIGPVGAAKAPFPQPSGVNKELQVNLNYYAFLAQVAGPNAGQCPAMTNVCREYLKINLPKLQKSSMGMFSGIGPIAAAGAAAFFILPKIFGGKRKTRRNPMKRLVGMN
jgi:hypothetical protein